MGLREWIIPQGGAFFSLLEKQSENNLHAVDEFRALLGDYGSLGQRKDRMHALEHKGDKIVREIFSKLSNTLVTPIEHEDIERLALRQDDVIDYLFAATNRLSIYGVEKPTPAMGKFAKIIKGQVACINDAVHCLPSLKKDEIGRKCARIDVLESEADALLYKEIALLFRTRDPIRVVKLKDIYEYLEIVTDKCEDVGNLLMNIRMKYG